MFASELQLGSCFSPGCGASGVEVECELQLAASELAAATRSEPATTIPSELQLKLAALLQVGWAGWCLHPGIVYTLFGS